MPRFSFQPLGDSWALVLVLLAALVVGVFWFGPKRKSLSQTRRRVELGLRLACVALFAVFFSRPSVVRVEKEELPASIVFLCDSSESMSILDGGSDVSRYDATRRAFESSRESFRALCEKFDVRVLRFDETTEELEIGEDGAIQFPDKPSGAESRLGDALAETSRSTAGKRLLRVVLFSDGSQRARDDEALTPQEVALRLRDAERAVDVFPIGSTEVSTTTRDVAILDLRANDHVFLGNELTVSGQVRLLGCAGLDVPLTLSLETSPGAMEVVGETTLRADSDDATLNYQFACKPEAPGIWKLNVAAPVQEYELVETNNELGAFVDALDRGVDALYIEGTRRLEQNFLRAALEDASDVRVKYWRPSTASLVAKSPDSTEAEMLAALAKSRKSLMDAKLFVDGKYATFVLGDVDASAFQPNELKTLAQLVENGAGLVVLAGERALSLGGYAETPLADVLPVQTRASDRLPLDSDLATLDLSVESSQRARFDGEFQAAPNVEQGRDDFLVRLSVDRKKNDELWRGLPALSSVYRLGKPKPNASTPLVATSASDRSSRLPLMVTQQFGLGRVVVLGTDSTWRWRMRGASAEHAKFWRQLLLWTAKLDDLLEGELAVELDRSRFAQEESVDFRVVYRPKPDENPVELRAQATIVGPDGSTETVELTEEQGVWRGVGRKTSASGDYLIEARVLSADGRQLQKTQARFLVYARNLELERPEANPGALEDLAQTSGGAARKLDELDAYLNELLQQRETIADYREVKRSLYDTWTLFAAFVALLAVDWILRKRWGLA